MPTKTSHKPSVASAPKNDPATPQDSPSPPAPRLPRCTLAEAMREIGLDERKIAGVMKDQVEALAKNPEEKMLLEAVKECHKILEPPQRAAVPEMPPAEIVHYVPRPDRPESSVPADEQGSDAACDPRYDSRSAANVSRDDAFSAAPSASFPDPSAT